MSSASRSRAQELLSRIGQPEGPSLEYKTTLRDTRQLSQILASFANTNGGTLLIGVQKPDRTVGCKASRMRRLFLATLENLRPPINPEFLAIQTQEGWVVAISVERQSELVIASGGAFKRTADRIEAMTVDEIMSRLTSDDTNLSMHSLAEAIAGQTEMIATLQAELQNANSFKSKLQDFIIGGLIGAVMGTIATLLIG